MAKVAELLGVGTVKKVRKWCWQAEIDAGAQSGLSSEESVKLRKLKAENA